MTTRPAPAFRRAQVVDQLIARAFRGVRAAFAKELRGERTDHELAYAQASYHAAADVAYAKNWPLFSNWQSEIYSALRSTVDPRGARCTNCGSFRKWPVPEGAMCVLCGSSLDCGAPIVQEAA